jgi:hypothetical protein
MLQWLRKGTTDDGARKIKDGGAKTGERGSSFKRAKIRSAVNACGRGW